MSEATHGQQNRKEIRQEVESALSNYCPNRIDRMANLIAYDFNLSPWTVRYTYLPMFIDKGILVQCGYGNYTVSAKGQHLQTTEDGLTDEQLGEELEEENEQRNKLGKPKVSLEEWKAMRSKRFKPTE